MTTTPTETWSYSLNDEDFHGAFATREEAISAAQEANDDLDEDERVSEFQVGIGVTVDFDRFMPSAEQIVEQAEDSAYSDFPAVDCEALVESPSKEAFAELDALITEWVRRHNLQCRWSDIDKTETVVVSGGGR